MGKLFGYHTLGVLLKSLSDSCFRADEQEKRGEKVTACGMSSDEIEDLCENYLPYALNPMLSTEEVKEKLHVSDATLNRMVARGRYSEWRVQEAWAQPILEEVGYSSLH